MAGVFSIRASGRHGWTLPALAFAAGMVPFPVQAGMVSYTLTDIARARLEVISFFLVLSLLLAFVFQRCWNGLAKDFQWLPALSFKKSLAVIFVTSLFCGLILTMISGARELMTPGAWDRVGAGYKLSDPKRDPAPWLDTARRKSMEQFRDALWQYAILHEGRLPDDPATMGAPASTSKAPDEWGTSYYYLPQGTRKVDMQGEAKSPDKGSYVLAWEPASFGAERFVLLSSGQVIKMGAGELSSRIAAGEVSAQASQGGVNAGP